MMKNGWTKRMLALATALLMMLSALPAALAVPADWAMLQIILSWTNYMGEIQTVYAMPVTDTEGVFWAMLAPEALYSEVTIHYYYPGHFCEFTPESMESRRFISSLSLISSENISAGFFCFVTIF